MFIIITNQVLYNIATNFRHKFTEIFYNKELKRFIFFAIASKKSVFFVFVWRYIKKFLYL